MLSEGTIIDEKYETLSALGVGGFGAVYKCTQKQLSRTVAVKTLNTTLLQETDGLARFEREARAIDKLKHKNIVGFYGYGVWQQAPYMVMELVEGTSVDKLLATEDRFDPLRALRIIRQVFDALSCAHAAGVVHRDLKPSNIMLTTDAEGKESVKLIDFGLAKLMPGYGVPGQKLTETGYALGTCHYMPPEQALGIPVDQRADIYATGCILYQMLTGKLPFDGDNNVAIMFKHINEQPQPLSQLLRPPAPVEAMSTLLDNCMAKQLDDRYPNCQEAIEHIDAILSGHLTKVAPVAVHSQKRSSVQQRKVPAKLLVGLAAGCLFGCFAADWLIKYQAEQARIQNVLNADHVQLKSFHSRYRVSRERDELRRHAKEIKERDDKYHHLKVGERIYVLTELGLDDLVGTWDPALHEYKYKENRKAHAYAIEADTIRGKIEPEAQPVLIELRNLLSAVREYGREQVLRADMLKSNCPEARIDVRRGIIENLLNDFDLDEAAKQLELQFEDLKYARVSSFLQGESHSKAADIAVLKGEFTKALSELQTASDLDDYMSGEPWTQLRTARIALMQGRYTDALRLAESTRSTAQTYGFKSDHPSVYLSRVIECSAHYGKGDEKSALAASESLGEQPRWCPRYWWDHDMAVLASLREKKTPLWDWKKARQWKKEHHAS
jgi:serine/threonine protein kinase